MRFAFLLLFCSCAQRPTSRLTLIPAMVVGLSAAHSSNHVTVFFRWPDETTIWFAEWTTNLTDWHRAQNETILPGGLRYTEGDTWGTERIWRLKRQ